MHRQKTIFEAFHDFLPEETSDNWAKDFLQIKEIHDDGIKGAGVKVAVIDNGILNDPQFHDENNVFDSERIVAKNVTGAKASDALAKIRQMDELDRQQFLEDPDFDDFDIDRRLRNNNQLHGSHMASYIGGNNGLAPHCNLLIINIHKNGHPKTILREQFLPLAIYYAIAQKAKIISISQEVSACSPQLHQAIKFAFTSQAIVVCSSGNSDNQNEPSIEFPGAFQKTFAIGGYEAFSKSNPILKLHGDQGRLIDFLAPATKVPSLLGRGANKIANGTSIACAIVAGILALYCKAHMVHKGSIPNYSKIKRNIIKTHSDFLGVEEEDFLKEKVGYGVLHPSILFNDLK